MNLQPLGGQRLASFSRKRVDMFEEFVAKLVKLNKRSFVLFSRCWARIGQVLFAAHTVRVNQKFSKETNLRFSQLATRNFADRPLKAN